MDIKETTVESLFQLLEAQYEHTVDYCNAQTALQNAFVTPSSSSASSMGTTTSTKINVASAVQSLQTSVSRVQMNLKRLENVLDDLNDDDEHKKSIMDRVVVQAWTNHVARSRRILSTLYATASFAPHGVPTFTTTEGDADGDDDVINRKTVALATLRASIHQVQEILNHRM
jgi:hypothetical protein